VNTQAPQLDHLDGSRLPPLTELGKKEFLRKHTGIEALDNPFSACINAELIGVIMSPYSREPFEDFCRSGSCNVEIISGTFWTSARDTSLRA